MMKRLHVFIFGLVQGVCFRQYTVRRANEFGLTGFIMNLANGSVEVVAEGEEEKLKEFAAWLEQGPPAANVESIEINWEKAIGEFGVFDVMS